MRYLRYLAYITLATAVGLCWLDFDRYDSYTHSKGGVCYRLNNEEDCLNNEHLSTHPKYVSMNLCGWENETCFRNAVVMSDATQETGCQWIYDIPANSWFRGRAERQLLWSMIARFGGLGSLSLSLCLLTLMSWFKKKPYGQCQQAVGGTLTMSMGVVITILAWLSGEPGQGMLISWIFLAMYASNIRYFIRMIILIMLSFFYGIMMYYYNPYKSTTRLCTNPYQYIGTRMFFVLFSIVSTALPIGLREIWLRQEHARKEAIEHSENLLNVLKENTHTLMSRLLPTHVVMQLSTQQRHERKAIAEFFSHVSIVFTDMVSLCEVTIVFHSFIPLPPYRLSCISADTHTLLNSLSFSFFFLSILQKGFTQFSSRVTPAELVAFLNDMYQRFDDIAAVEGIFKVEIIGDAYFGVAGCPKPCQQHAEKCALGKKF